MKKKLNLVLILALAVSISACKNQKKVEKSQNQAAFNLVASTASVKWTAYKTTEKKPVSGIFKTVNITNSAGGKTALLALNNTQFSIPVSSLFSNNEERDGKLINLFFGVMENTTLLSGTIKADADKTGSLEVTMNGTTASLPLTFTIAGDTLKFKGVMDLDQWQTTAALNSLNKACFDLHKGPDGISKTWNDVLIEASVVVKK
jgi:YceI-like domain